MFLTFLDVFTKNVFSYCKLGIILCFVLLAASNVTFQIPSAVISAFLASYFAYLTTTMASSSPSKTPIVFKFHQMRLDPGVPSVPILMGRRDKTTDMLPCPEVSTLQKQRAANRPASPYPGPLLRSPVCSAGARTVHDDDVVHRTDSDSDPVNSRQL